MAADDRAAPGYVVKRGVSQPEFACAMIDRDLTLVIRGPNPLPEADLAGGVAMPNSSSQVDTCVIVEFFVALVSWRRAHTVCQHIAQVYSLDLRHSW